MKAATLEFVKQRFAEYYQKDILMAPPSVEQREWAFVFFEHDYPEIRMRRHIGFGTKAELFSYLSSMAPAHAYYSCAYYATPQAATMNEKGWLGADLIFDLDADHITRGPYDLMLSRVKQETEKLLSMLTEELGFQRERIDLIFSGGRGYHLHIRDISVRGWGSAERRELVDYVCGIGIDPGIMISMRTHSPRGWHQRYISSVIEYLVGLEELDEKEALSRLSSLEGVGKVTAEDFMRRKGDLLTTLRSDPVRLNLKDQAFSRIIKGLSEDREGEFYHILRGKAALADEPVTTDVKRLIRLPASLHGGSGFRVTPVAARDFADFDPLTDAVIFGDRTVKIELQRGLSMKLMDSDYRLEKGENAVPEALAVFLCCRGMAEIAGGADRASR